MAVSMHSGNDSLREHITKSLYELGEEGWPHVKNKINKHADFCRRRYGVDKRVLSKNEEDFFQEALLRFYGSENNWGKFFARDMNTNIELRDQFISCIKGIVRYIIMNEGERKDSQNINYSFPTDSTTLFEGPEITDRSLLNGDTISYIFSFFSIENETDEKKKRNNKIVLDIISAVLEGYRNENRHLAKHLGYSVDEIWNAKRRLKDALKKTGMGEVYSRDEIHRYRQIQQIYGQPLFAGEVNLTAIQEALTRSKYDIKLFTINYFRAQLKLHPNKFVRDHIGSTLDVLAKQFNSSTLGKNVFWHLLRLGALLTEIVHC